MRLVKIHRNVKLVHPMLIELTNQTIPVHAKKVSMMMALSFAKHVLIPVKHA